MMRNLAPGPVVDPNLVWWRSCGPVSVRREPAPPEVVHRRVREEDEHVHRYMAAMDVSVGERSNFKNFLRTHRSW